MSDTEYVKVEIPRLAELDAAIDKLTDELIAVKAERQGLVNAEAQKIAAFEVGYEFENRSSRWRITAIKGDYYDGTGAVGQPIVWVRYIGNRLFKNGKTGQSQTVYPK